MAATKKLHADASPSSSSIWLNCPASVTKARGRVRKPTVYTTEGTAAHVAAELSLKGDDIPVTLTIDGQPVAVTEEMLDAVDDLCQLRLVEGCRQCLARRDQGAYRRGRGGFVRHR